MNSGYFVTFAKQKSPDEKTAVTFPKSLSKRNSKIGFGKFISYPS